MASDVYKPASTSLQMSTRVVTQVTAQEVDRSRGWWYDKASSVVVVRQNMSFTTLEARNLQRIGGDLRSLAYRGEMQRAVGARCLSVAAKPATRSIAAFRAVPRLQHRSVASRAVNETAVAGESMVGFDQDWTNFDISDRSISTAWYCRDHLYPL